RVDAGPGPLGGGVPVGRQPGGISIAANGRVWVSNELSGTLSEIDPGPGKVVKTVTVGALPQALALDGDTVYVAAQVPLGQHRGGTLTLAIANPPGFYENPLPQSPDPPSGDSASQPPT